MLTVLVAPRRATIFFLALLPLLACCGKAMPADPVAVYSQEVKDKDGNLVGFTDGSKDDKGNPVVKKLDTGDTAWMLTSSAFVLMMTGPGLALFYSGLVRRKNVLATMMQSFILMAIVSIVWAVVGFSLAFDVGNPFIGGFRFLFMKNVWMFPSEYAPTIPFSTFMV